MDYSIKILACFFSLLNASLVMEEPNEMDIVGKWKNAENSMTIEVLYNKKTFSAKIIASRNPSDVGKIVLWGLTYNSKDKEWGNGYVQLPEMKHPADCFIRLSKNNTSEITGYHVFRSLGRTQLFYKIAKLN